MKTTILIRSRRVLQGYDPWIPRGARVLDVGCGNGVMAQQLQKALDLDLTGTDVLSYLTTEIRFKAMEEENKLPFEDGVFDAACFTDALHHCDSYETQEALLLDAGRVARQVLLFEMKPTLVSRLWDSAINRIHNPRMRIPFNFRTREGWLELFAKLGFESEVLEIPASWNYPLTHWSFRLVLR